MKYAIFGTGRYYMQYSHYINSDDVLFLLDNDEAKWDKTINGKKVFSPMQVSYDECDFVLIMIQQYEKIEDQLESYGVPKNKIKSYYDISSLYNLTADVVCAEGNLDLESWKRKRDGKSIFVCSHEFSRTGVPVALMHVCNMLKTMGYEVLFAGLLGGTLEKEIRENGIDYIGDLGLFYENGNILKTIQEFDLIFLGSVCTNHFGLTVSECGVPIVWWLHESYDIFYEKYKLVIRNNIHYFAGGRRVINKFKKYYPSEEIREMLYFLPEVDNAFFFDKGKEVINFAVIGVISKRKGQDIFVQAIEQIDEENIKKAKFIMVGSLENAQWINDFMLKIKENESIQWINEMNQKQLEDFYRDVDVLVCPSRDDPMPIVVTQAFQNKIPCIVSNEVGQSEYLMDGYGGDVFISEDVNGLRDAIMKYINDKELLCKKGLEAERIFNEYFSEEAMRRNLEEITRNLIKENKECSI